MALRLLSLFEELHQAVDQPAAAANHVEPAFVLMFLQNVIDLALQVGHWRPPTFGLTLALFRQERNLRLLGLP